MPHYYPVVVPSGKSLAGDSLGFHAYSLRIDNLTNQWLLEETSLAWIPPYSLGVCLRLYGTGVGILLNQAPVGQPQLTPLTGEQTVGVYSDQIRTEVAGTPVRQFSLVQSVSDLTQGPQPALPPVGVDRLWADNQGFIHHIHSNGVDTTLPDNLQSQVITTGMLQNGAVGNQQLATGAASANIGALASALQGTLPNAQLRSWTGSPPANVSISNAGWVNVLQLAPPAGHTYLAWANVTVQNATNTTNVWIRFWNGATTLAEAIVSVTPNYLTNLSLFMSSSQSICNLDAFSDQGPATVQSYSTGGWLAIT